MLPGSVDAILEARYGAQRQGGSAPGATSLRIIKAGFSPHGGELYRFCHTTVMNLLDKAEGF